MSENRKNGKSVTHQGGEMIFFVISLLLTSTSPSSSSPLPDGMITTMANISLLLSREHSTQCIQIFHDENLTDYDRQVIHDLWRALSVPESHTTTGVYSFNQYVKRKMKKPRKVTCYRPMKILIGSNSTRIGYTYMTQNLRMTDSVWLLFLDSDIDDFLGETNTLIDCLVIVAQMQSENFFRFYEAYRVRKDYPLRSQYYGSWTREGGLDIVKSSLYTRRTDLEGLVLRVESHENWPTSWFGRKKWRGFLPRIWSVIEDQINCSSIYQPSIDGLVGMQDPNGTWNGLIGMVLRNEIDVIVAEITLEKTRTHVLDFSRPLICTRYQMYFRQLGYSLQWDSIFKPFGKSIWFALLFWLVLGSVVISIAYYLSARSGLESDPEVSHFRSRSFFFVLQTLSQQGYHAVPRSTSCRILFFLPYIVSAIVIPSYSASLISYLTQQVPYRPFNTLEEMHEDGKYRLLIKENTAEYGYFKNAESELLKDIFKKQVLTVPPKHRMENTSHAFKILCHNANYAFFGKEIIMNSKLGRTLVPDCPIIVTTNPVAPIYLSMGIIKNSPYSALINHHVVKILTNGVVKRIEMEELPRTYQEPDAPLREVALDGVFQIFVFLGVSVILSVFILIMERKHFARVNGKKKSRKGDVESCIGQRPWKQVKNTRNRSLPISMRRYDEFLN